MTDRERLTTDKRKIFARESPTIMSMNKDELRKHYNEIFDRLQEYEVAEEQGQLIRPPCQEKDEFFILEKTQDGTRVTKLIVRFVSIYKNRFEIYCDTEARDGGYHFEPCRIGEDIYYTKEEAGKALRGGEQK